MNKISLTSFLLFFFSNSAQAYFKSIASFGKPSNAVAEIKNISTTSTCNTNWKRGRPPEAFVAGMAITFAKSLCRLREGQAPAIVMSKKNSSSTSKDALAHYEDRFEKQNLEINKAGPESLKAIYTLGVGLGIKESGGRYCEGWDVKAGSKRKSADAEAGLFQSSLSSIEAAPELKSIYEEYLSGQSGCLLEVFAKGISCNERRILGDGEGARFQKLAKTCPAFAAEYAMLSLRVVRTHYGPINSRLPEINPDCDSMFGQVQQYVENSPSKICSALL